MFSFPGLVLATLAQLLDLTRTTVDLVMNLLSLVVSDNCILSLFGDNVAGVTVYGFFLSVQQLRRHAHIVDVCACCLDRVNKTAVPVYAGMRLVAEVLCVAHFRLVGIRIALLVLVFGGRRHRNDRGIHNRSFLENQAALHEHHNDLCEKLLLQAMLNQQIAESAQRRILYQILENAYFFS